MFDWWVEQPPFLRTTVALVPLVCGVGLMFTHYWRFGIGGIAIGMALLAYSFPSRAEKKGYHDF